MKLTRQMASQPRRDAWVEVDLGAIEFNTEQIRRIIGPEKRLMAILKADAYGHGAIMCLPTLEASGIDMVGVASVDEALQIRQAGIELPVLVIGMVPDWAMRMAVDQDVQITIFDTYRLEGLKQIHQETRRPVSVQIKVDTGMHRIGVNWREAPEFIRHCQQAPYLKLEGIFSHLAATDKPELTALQLERWHQVLANVNPLPPHVHIANSAGAMHYPAAQGNLVRVGIAFFGYDFFEYDAGKNASQKLLKPAMGLKARIIHVQDVPAGEGISYGPTYHTPLASFENQPAIRKIATLPLGYADGIPRNLSNKIGGLIRGHWVPQVGTITMDQMMLDVTDLPASQSAMLGETVTLLGEELDVHNQPPHAHCKKITLSDWARLADTIEYELMCQLRVRLPKAYIR